MDQNTKKILERFQFHSKVKKYLTIFCYFSIISGVLIYGFYAAKKGKSIKIVTDYKKNKKNFEIEKTMLNPRMKYQYKENDIYDIKAKKAFHKNNSQAKFFKVNATGKIGNIKAGELNINEEGNRLIFSDNPVLILNKTKK